MCNTLLAVAAQHLEGLVAPPRARQVIFPPALLVRSITEISAYVSWLLDPRPTTRQRAARVFLARIDDVTRSKAASAALGHKSAAWLGKAVSLAGSLMYLEQVHEAEGLEDGRNVRIPVQRDAPYAACGRPTCPAAPARARFQLEDATYPYRLSRAGLMSFIKGWALLASYLGYDQEPSGDLGEEIDQLPKPKSEVDRLGRRPPEVGRERRSMFGQVSVSW